MDSDKERSIGSFRDEGKRQTVCAEIYEKGSASRSNGLFSLTARGKAIVGFLACIENAVLGRITISIFSLILRSVYEICQKRRLGGVGSCVVSGIGGLDGGSHKTFIEGSLGLRGRIVPIIMS